MNKMQLGEIKELTLERDNFTDSVLYKLKPHQTIRFRIGPSLIGATVHLFSNYGQERCNYKRLDWNYMTVSDKTSYFADVTVDIPGSFHFFLTANQDGSGSKISGGYFLVDPELSCHGKPVPMDSIVCQTVLSKLLGPLNTWEEKLKVAYNSGYNMIHFTPIQALGASNSAYSLCDQQALNKTFSDGSCNATFQGIQDLLNTLRRNYGMLSICDIVLNHTANETTWLKDQPDATYNMINCPHLRPAFLLDRAIARLAMEIGDGRWTCRGIPKGRVGTEPELRAAIDLLRNHYLPQVNIHELYMVDVDLLTRQFHELCKRGASAPASQMKVNLQIVQDPEYRRFKSSVDMDVANSLINVRRSDAHSEDDRVRLCVEAFKSTIQWLNKAKKEEIDSHLTAALDNIFKGASYERLDSKGPKKSKCSERDEFIAPYFTCPTGLTFEEEMFLLYNQRGGMCMAHNGWVMGDDPLSNFARPGSNVYLRRELVAWGDSVKLRYGDRPEDSPFLWNYMKEYTVMTAKLFDGIRLDNCHSTPLHVASYMLDHARKVNKNLYVVAELFTGSESQDNIFVNRLGITSLIREGMAAWDSHELGRLVYKYGGKPVGAFASVPQDHSTVSPRVKVLVGEVAHALFLDWTHDNPSPAEKRTLYDMLPSAGLVAMAACAAGSNRGYDELVPHHIHVVNENRQYGGWKYGEVSENVGMVTARKRLCELHVRLAMEGFTEVYVDQLSPNMVAVTRHCPKDRRSVIMVAHNKFNESVPDTGCHRQLEVEGQLDQIIMEGRTVRDSNMPYMKNGSYINGSAGFRVEVKGPADRDFMVQVFNDSSSGKVRLNLGGLVPGSLFVVAVKPLSRHAEALAGLDRLDHGKLVNIVSKLRFEQVQFALYQGDQEGRESGGFGCYNIPGFGNLNYCGLAGIMPLLDRMRPNNDLGHPLAANLREGNWLMEYIVSRLNTRIGTKELAAWFNQAFRHVGSLPRFLIPAYFDSIVSRVYHAISDRGLQLLSPFVSKGSEFVQLLAQGTYIHLASVPSAPLPPMCVDRPDSMTANFTCPPNLAAGLPHFSTGYMRSWGRDTFISMRGLLLTTGLYTEARDIILAYAGCLRHGLIPNLLDGGNNARFNCRDAVWWWLRAIMDYIQMCPNGASILECPVNRLFPSDDQNSHRGAKVEPLKETIHEALTKHWVGQRFREWNAGHKIDEHMRDNGFNNQIGVVETTGFVFGGNTDNCGTWMDKMGSSEAAGTKGVPSTPRDGSAVEIIGLSYSCIKDLANLPQYPYKELHRDGMYGRTSLREWAEKIRQNFERYFWIGSKNGASMDEHPDLVNLTNIYKDSLGSGHKFTDYQLRPNFLITLAVAPDLVDARNGWAAIQTARQRILGPLGLATLDSKDWAYRGDYDNSNQSNDPSVAHGANYHQGPEWLWPVGFLLRAMLNMAARLGGHQLAEAKADIFQILSRHYAHLRESDWLGLPELTNQKGAFCRDSNPVQAWSHATLLETLYDLNMSA